MAKNLLSEAARLMGKKGGAQRSKALSTPEKRRIASLGGKAKALKDKNNK